jgi:phosphatidylserine decarboxylase-like protein
MRNSTHHRHRSSRLGHWLPSDRKHLNAWLAPTAEIAEKKAAPFHPVILEFQELIESDPVMLMYFTQMFEQQPSFAPPPQSGDMKIRNYHQMLRILDHVLTTAPEFSTDGMVGCPINAVLDFPMITPGRSGRVPQSEVKSCAQERAGDMGAVSRLAGLPLCSERNTYRLAVSRCLASDQHG